MNIKILISIVLCSALTAHADEAEQFDINVIGTNELVQLTYTGQDGTKLQNAMNFTVHDQTYGLTMLCQGKDNKFRAGAHTSGATSGSIKFRHDYSGDHRKSCDNVSSQIKSPYWIVDLGTVFYYDNSGSLRGCDISKLPNVTGNPNKVTYDLLDKQSPFYNKLGLSLSAVYANSGINEMEFDITSDKFLIAGEIDDSRDLYGIDIGGDIRDKNIYNCDPRLGSQMSLKNLVSYSFNYYKTINFGYNLRGINLIEPGQNDYPSYRFKVKNNTDHDISILNNATHPSFIQYCQNTTDWQTVGYVFKEASSWVASSFGLVDGASEVNGNKFVDDIDENAQNQILSKASSNSGVFSDCNDGTSPITQSLVMKNTITIAKGQSQDITGMFILNDFDNFYDIALSYQDMATGQKYTYNLSPSSIYKPITFNQGFHDVLITIDNNNQATLESVPDVPFVIVNYLMVGDTAQ